MNAMMSFSRTMMTLPKPWVGWVIALFAVNFVVLLFYMATIEGRLVLAAALIAAIVQLIIFSRLGLVRLLGIAHLPWLALVIWLAARLDGALPDNFFGMWLLAVIALNTLSLLIDASDVARYAMGERDPQLERVGWRE